MTVQYRTNVKGEELTIEDRLMNAKEAAKTCGISRSAIYKLMEQNSFPPRHQISGNRVGWLEADVLEFIKLGAAGFKALYGNTVSQMNYLSAA
jgi:predicted DNA-binding transcriptional regulator AlpA